ncbi:DUF3392 family protein [Thiomicrorhabdus sp. Kp2]|uniref:DUF3392 family protein n=1 Tax=Thiomicrorhabdus sp. Kp2 TaxID=1123518 RepID=UPI00042A8632|nr:DUF3392 family protein [Thiomicrorhabdus sp. Kp2]
MDILNWLNDILLHVSGWMKGYLNQIVLSMVATLLVIYGDNILGMLKQQIGSLKLFLRITLFVAFCAFGFSFITSIAAPFMSNWLAKSNPEFLPFIIVFIYYGLGYLAQKKGML